MCEGGKWNVYGYRMGKLDNGIDKKSYVEKIHHPRARAMRFRTSVVTISVTRGIALGLMMRRAKNSSWGALISHVASVLRPSKH